MLTELGAADCSQDGNRREKSRTLKIDAVRDAQNALERLLEKAVPVAG